MSYEFLACEQLETGQFRLALVSPADGLPVTELGNMPDGWEPAYIGYSRFYAAGLDRKITMLVRGAVVLDNGDDVSVAIYDMDLGSFSVVHNSLIAVIGGLTGVDPGYNANFFGSPDSTCMFFEGRAGMWIALKDIGEDYLTSAVFVDAETGEISLLSTVEYRDITYASGELIAASEGAGHWAGVSDVYSRLDPSFPLYEGVYPSRVLGISSDGTKAFYLKFDFDDWEHGFKLVDLISSTESLIFHEWNMQLRGTSFDPTTNELFYAFYRRARWTGDYEIPASFSFGWVAADGSGRSLFEAPDPDYIDGSLSYGSMDLEHVVTSGIVLSRDGRVRHFPEDLHAVLGTVRTGAPVPKGFWTGFKNAVESI